jgi:hypothetical protein
MEQHGTLSAAKNPVARAWPSFRLTGFFASPGTPETRFSSLSACTRARWWSGVLRAICFLAASVSAQALEWNSTLAEAKTAPFQTALEVSFAFKNTGDRPVVIRDVETNCDCVEAATDRKIYHPGEAGRLVAHFTVGDRFGLYERVISVTTDDAPEPAHLLVRIIVPDLAVVTPRVLDWKQGAPAAEQTAELRAAEGLTVDFTQAEPTDESFRVRLEAVEPGRLYRLHAAPVSTAKPANAAVRIYGRDKTGHAVLVSAYLNIN